MTPWWQAPAKAQDESARASARLRQTQLTKPPGSLGRLEWLAIDLAAMQGRERPRIERPGITIFAADHGVVAEGVSAFPQAVTQQMLANFVNGGAAIAVLARAGGADLEVVDAGTLAPAPLPGVRWAKAGDGSANFCHEAAMSEAQLAHCLDLGRDVVERALARGRDLFIGGEMGIGNTTAAAALACALLGLPGRDLAGPGTGLDGAGVSHKAAVIDRALALHGFTPRLGTGGLGISRVAPEQAGQIPPSPPLEKGGPASTPCAASAVSRSRRWRALISPAPSAACRRWWMASSPPPRPWPPAGSTRARAAGCCSPMPQRNPAMPACSPNWRPSRCSTWTCAWARVAARRRHCRCCAWPANCTAAWRPSPRPA